MSAVARRWGPPLTEYLSVYAERSKEFALLAASGSEQLLQARAQKTMNKLLKSNTSTWNLQEDVLLLTQHHRYMSVLIAPRFISNALDAVQEYERQCTDHIFTQYSGFLGIHVVIRALQFGMLVQSNTLEAFESLVVQAENHLNICDALTKYTCSLIEESMQISRNDQYSWIFDPAFKKGTDISPVGYVSFDDLELLFSRLWKDRKMFTMVCAHTYIPGWTSLFFAFFIHLKRLSDEVGRTPRHRLIGLFYRFMIVTPLDDEIVTVGKLFTAIAVRDGHDFDVEIYDPVDEEDARVIALSFIKLMDPNSSSSFGKGLRLMLSLINSLIFECTTFDKVPELAPACMRAVYLHSWSNMVVESTPQLENHKITKDHVFSYARYILMYTSAVLDTMKTEIDMLYLMAALVDADMISLIAQTLFLLPYSDEKNWQSMLVETNRNVTNIIWSLNRAKDAGISLEVFENTYSDWAKAMKICLGHLGTYGETHALYLYPSVVRECLSELGETLGFELKSSDVVAECAYSRCSDPNPSFGTNFVCYRCCVTRYCSQRCQSLDWSSPLRSSHKNHCTDVYDTA